MTIVEGLSNQAGVVAGKQVAARYIGRSTVNPASNR